MEMSIKNPQMTLSNLRHYCSKESNSTPNRPTGSNVVIFTEFNLLSPLGYLNTGVKYLDGIKVNDCLPDSMYGCSVDICRS